MSSQMTSIEFAGDIPVDDAFGLGSRLPDDRAGVILALPPADGRDPPLDE
jgi:hypothetical protein